MVQAGESQRESDQQADGISKVIDTERHGHMLKMLDVVDAMMPRCYSCRLSTSPLYHSWKQSQNTDAHNKSARETKGMIGLRNG